MFSLRAEAPSGPRTRRQRRRRRRLRLRRRRERRRRLRRLRLRRQRLRRRREERTEGAAGTLRVAAPSPETLHLLNRFTYGWTPALHQQMEDAGGPLAWFERQLRPEQVGDTFADGFVSWFPRLGWSSQDIVEARAKDRGASWQVMADLDRWTLLRRTYSNRQLQEVMAELWSNLLHIPVPEDKSWPFRVDYDRMIRTYALGRFDEMLHAAATHPAMLCYLDNARSAAADPNENLGRELLELHTVGRLGGYDERDVRDSTMILTGYRVDTWGSWVPSYSTKDHYVGPVRVMGFSDDNMSPDGRDLVRRYTRYLAQHPATAQRVAHRLAVRFVADDPPPQLVNDLENVYLASGTDITAVLRALARHPDFGCAVATKVRTPTEDLVASLRVLEIVPVPPTGGTGPRPDDLACSVLPMSEDTGQRPFDWGRPDGTPDNSDAWTSMSRMLGSWKVHANLAGGHWPRSGATRPDRSHWLPHLPAGLDAVVDHMSRLLTGRPAGERVVEAAALACGLPTDAKISTETSAGRQFLARGVTDVLTTLLDSPAHMRR
jgi:hypothetical protein